MKQIIFFWGLLPFFLCYFISCTNPFPSFFTNTEKFSFTISDDGTLFFLGEKNDFGIPTTKVVHKDIIELELPKNHPCPFLLFPTNNTIADREGFVYPYNRTFIPKTEIINQKANTYSAYIFLRLIELSEGNSSEIYQRTSQFNWRKFSQTVEKKLLENQEKEDYSPWNYNQEKILTSIADGTFTASRLK